MLKCRWIYIVLKPDFTTSFVIWYRTEPCTIFGSTSNSSTTNHNIFCLEFCYCISSHHVFKGKCQCHDATTDFEAKKTKFSLIYPGKLAFSSLFLFPSNRYLEESNHELEDGACLCFLVLLQGMVQLLVEVPCPITNKILTVVIETHFVLYFIFWDGCFSFFF